MQFINTGTSNGDVKSKQFLYLARQQLEVKI